MKIISLIYILITFNSFAYENNFSIRDSQTGASVNANVTVHLIDKDLIPIDVWHEIKRGNLISNKHVNSSFDLTIKNNKYVLKTDDLLQYIVINAEGYQALRTHIGPNSTIKLTAIMLDKLKSKISCKESNICGYIYDKSSLKPLSNVEIFLSNNQTRFQSLTNSLGYFEFKQVVPENAVLTTTYKGYKSHVLYGVPAQSNFNVVIDIEKGNGVIEKSMRHPLNDVLTNRVDKHWLKAKLSHKKSESHEKLRERSSEAVYLEPPSSIRVGFNGSGSTCCGASCSTSQVYSLETYVQRGLDDEWIASWQTDSLKAGSIPYRSYGAWHVLNEVYTGYDICAGPCCQAFGFTGHSASITAAMATNGIMLDKNGEVARSEYSAQNNSWDDPNDGLTCNNADLSCGDGSVGSPVTGWTCLTDTVSIGRGCFGHGRGMSQWGTQFHAQDNASFADIVDHYYNGSNNPSEQRSQYASTPIRLDSINNSINSVSANEVLIIEYDIFSSANDTIPFGPILLGASIVNDDNSYSDPSNDFPASLTVSGTNNIQRPFQVPSNVVPGSYDLVASVYLDVNADNNITADDWKLVTTTLPKVISVLNENDLIFKDSF